MSVHIFKLTLIFERKDSVVGSIFGDFKITPQTRVVGNVAAAKPHSLTLSQLWFSRNGELSIRFDNNDVGVVYTNPKI